MAKIQPVYTHQQKMAKPVAHLLCSLTEPEQKMRFFKVCKRIVQTLRLMIGIHDYQHYYQHMLAQHPDITPMDQKEFYHYCLNARFPGKGGKTTKCPC